MPVLSLEGPPSSGKTTAAHLLSRLIDPTAAPFADPAASHRELTGDIHRNWLIAFDNVERLLPRLATFINSLAAGTSQHVRQPHDPHDPVSTHFQRPVLLTGSGLASASPSLQTRALRATLAPLPPERNRPLTEIFSEFEEILPQLLALICTALSAALRNLKHVKPARLPRLADALVWAMAAAPALGLTEEEILAAMDPDPDPDDPLVGSVKSLMNGRPSLDRNRVESGRGPVLDPEPERRLPRTQPSRGRPGRRRHHHRLQPQKQSPHDRPHKPPCTHCSPISPTASAITPAPWGSSPNRVE